MLLTAISVEVQRSNSQMILERKPLPEDLIESVFVKCELAVSKRRSKVQNRIRKKKLGNNLKPVLKEPDQKSEIVRRSDIDVVIDEKQVLQVDDKTAGKMLQLDIPQKYEPPDLPNIPRCLRKNKENDYVAKERVMATQIQATGLNTSTKALIPKSEICPKILTGIAMEIEYPHQNEAIHWEPPDFRGSVLAQE